MGTTRVVVEVELELDDASPAAVGAALRKITDRIAAGSLDGEGSGSGDGVAARWSARSYRDLVECIGCKRHVPRAETDITEDGERCRRCTMQGEVTQHWLNVENNAEERGFRRGVLTGMAVGELLDDD